MLLMCHFFLTQIALRFFFYAIKRVFFLQLPLYIKKKIYFLCGDNQKPCEEYKLMLLNRSLQGQLKNKSAVRSVKV